MTIIILLCCLVTGTTACCTYAFLLDRDFAANAMGITENEIHIEERFDPPVDPRPGSVITKAPKVVNDSSIAVYVRMAVQFSDSDARAMCEPLSINKGWTLREDGYYYYADQLEPGKMTNTLFDKVQIRASIKEEDLIPFDILVYAESVQANGMTAEEAWAVQMGGSR